LFCDVTIWPVAVLDCVAPSRAADVWCLPALQFNSILGQQSQAAQGGSMFTNYGGSKMSQMLVGFVLQFSAFQFAFLSSKAVEKKPQKKKK
jgi:hypothetical protein